jgi:hypothetical protein
MAVSSTAILDQIAKFIIYLSDAPSYWYSLNKSCNDEFHLARRFGMDRVNFEALIIAGNLAKYKGNSLCILADQWETFIRGHHFSDLSPDFCSIEIERKNMTINHIRENFYVARIGRIVDRTILKFEKQYQMNINPPRMNSLRIQQQALCRATDLAVANIYINQYQKGKRNVIMATSAEVIMPIQQQGINATKLIGSEVPSQPAPTNIAGRQRYPLLAGIYGDAFDPNNHETQS